MRLGGGSFDVVSQAPPFNPGDNRSSFRAPWGTTDFHAMRIGLNYRFLGSAGRRQVLRTYSARQQS
jgi:hypothetical protein